ncbi:MAG: hypothetical protein ACI4LP_10960 [Anaerovoracaceae bacterium]
MRKWQIRFDESEAHDKAEERFIRSCGFDLNRAKHQRMFEMGKKVREDGIAGIDIRAIVSFFDADVFEDNRIKIGEESITFPYLTRISPKSVSGIYFYILTVGECLFSSEENIMDFLYADIWGTSYVDSSMELLREKIVEDMKKNVTAVKEPYLSEEFGPGYFGMEVADSKKIMRALNGNDIGVKVKDSGLIIPQKSCAGFFFVCNEPGFKTEKSCIKCRGNSKGCEFCKKAEQMEG